MKHIRSDAYWKRYRNAWGRAERAAFKVLRAKHEQEFLLLRELYLTEELARLSERETSDHRVADPEPV